MSESEPIPDYESEMVTDAEAISDRLRESLKSPYDADGDVWQALLAAFGHEVASIEETRGEILQTKSVSDACTIHLDRIAELFQLERQREESTEAFRARLKVALRSFITSATVNEVRDVVAVILETDEANINIVEPDDEIAFFQVAVDTEETGELPIDPQDMSEIVGEVSAAGVKVGANIFISETGVLILTADDVENELTTEAGLSSTELASLSSDEWEL